MAEELANTIKRCKYGCGNEGVHQFKNGEWCCCKNLAQCPVNRKKISQTRTGIIFSAEHKKNISKGQMGRIASPETREKLSKAQKARPLRNLSAEHKKQISKVHKGKTISEKHKKAISDGNKGKKHPFYGKPLSSEHRKKLSCAKQGIKICDWSGFVSNEDYCDMWSVNEFKDYIKKRDGYKCQNPDCWGTSDKLCVMHIDHIKMNCHPDNLITGCVSCNARANKDREWHTAWYQAIMYRQGKLLKHKRI